MWVRLGLYGFLFFLLNLFQSAAQDGELAKCAAIGPSVERLSCYDELARKLKLDSPRVQLEQNGIWHLLQEKSKIDDSLSVTLIVDGDTKFEGWLKTATPVLMLRCKEGKTAAYVITGMPQYVERSNLYGATVTIRFDDSKAFQLKMSQSTDGEALFFANAKEFIQRMAKHSRMLFQFTPFNAPPTMTTFQIGGLEDAIKPLKSACHWGQ